MNRRIIMLAFLLLLSGCWDIEEADRMDYVHGLGVDYKDGRVTVYLQIVNLGNLGKSETGSGGGGNQAVLASVSSDNINSAIFKIYKSAQRRLFWGHLTFIVLTEEALKHNKIKEVIDLMDRYRETRYRILFFATKDNDLEKLMEAAPIFDGSPIFSRLTDLNNTYEQSSFIKDVSMRELLIALNEPGHNGIMPAVTTTEKTWTSEQETETMIKAEGVAISNKKTFKGFITGEDINGLRWMTEEANRNNLELNKNGKPAAELIVVKPVVSVNPVVKGGGVKFNANIEATVVINELIQDVDKDFLVKESEKNIKKEILETYEKALEIDADIYQLSEVLYRRDIRAWKKVEKYGKVKLDENSLNVSVNIQIRDSKVNKIKPIVD